MWAVPSPLPCWSGYGGPQWADILGSEIHRASDCAAYDACLQRMAVEAAEGWSCCACKAYSRDPDHHIRIESISQLVMSSAEVSRDAVVRRVEKIREGMYPTLYVTAETYPSAYGPRHRVLGPVAAYLGAVEAGLAAVHVIHIARAACPSCAEATQLKLIEEPEVPVQRDGFCPVCRRFIDATEFELEYVHDRSREYEEKRRAIKKAHQLIQPKPTKSTFMGKMERSAKIVGKVFKQLDLLGQEWRAP